ncbi:MAG: J domain-containing protein [Alphaproteobacteria bacterium]
MVGQRKSRVSAPQASIGPALRGCDHEGCRAEGIYRAPRSREQLEDYYWFCLEHVREYNRSWNYFTGMTEREVERLVRSDTVWHRPSWPLGSRLAYRFTKTGRVHDHFGFFKTEKKSGKTERPALETEEEKAFRVLDLTPPTTVEKIKARYKLLVKRHHPDTHGGDKAKEDRLKEIILAYHTLMNVHCP